MNLVFIPINPVIRYLQFVLAIYGFVEAMMYFYLNYNVRMISIDHQQIHKYSLFRNRFLRN